MKKQTIKYSVDSQNRLIIKRKAKTLTTCGNFSVDHKNRLIYFLNNPAAWRRLNKLDGKIVFEGNWRLDPEHNLQLVVTKINNLPSENLLSLKGSIISTDKDILAFQIKTLNKENSDQFYLMTLSGQWQADVYNRLCFAVKKDESPDILTFICAWQVNKNQQITYTYAKQQLKTKTKICNLLVFEGFWQINTSNRITYILKQSTKSVFDFRVQVETPNLYPKAGVIKYRLGMGVREDADFKEQVISLYGAWKFSRKLGLSFEMDYGKNKLQAIDFEAEANLTGRDEVIFILTDKKREPLGFSIAFKHKFLKTNDADFFLKLKKSVEESRIEAGVHIPF